MKQPRDENVFLRQRLQKELERTKHFHGAKPPQQQRPSGNVVVVSHHHDKMKKKLQGARFRYINECLYTMNGEHALKVFQEDPNLFQVYHDGFRTQLEKWPINPLDIYIHQLKEQWAIDRRSLVLADFGCGEARLASSLLDKHKVYSFDLVAINDRVIKCDMAHVPLEEESVDIVIFCLSLMGVNSVDYLREARRVLRSRGILKIAEVTSRFPNGFEEFIGTMKRDIGFENLSMDRSNSHFVMMEFKKGKSYLPKKQDSSHHRRSPSFLLKPCIYKKR